MDKLEKCILGVAGAGVAAATIAGGVALATGAPVPTQAILTTNSGAATVIATLKKKES